MWIASGGVVEKVVVAAPLTLPQPPASSDSESKVRASNNELPSPWQLISKVQQLDNVEHILDKGLGGNWGQVMGLEDICQSEHLILFSFEWGSC